MSARVLPKLTPSCVTAGKEQNSVIVEFPRDLPKDVLVTFDFFYESTAKKLSTVPAVALGPRTVRANFPEFPKPGEVEIVVKLAREESSLFPKFKFHVQSPAEAIYHSVPTSKETNRIPLLASILAYLLNSDVEKDKDVRSHTDVVLCNILQMLNRQEIPDWNLGSLLCGSHGLEENLLHFCMRRKLDGMAELLLQPRLINGKEQLLRQKGHDSKTPADIARKNGMKRICDQMEMMAGKSEYKKGKRSQEEKQKKKPKVKKTVSADTSTAHSMEDVGPLPLSIPKGGKKKRKLTGISRIKSVFVGKDAHVISPPRMPGAEPKFSKSWSVQSAGSATEDTLESPILRSGSNRLQAPYPLPERPRSYTTADPLLAAETSALSIRKLRAFSVPSDSDLENVPMQLHTSDGDLITSMTPEEDESVDDSVESSMVSALGSTALNAVQELKKKCLYTAVVTRHYRWAASPYGEFVLHVGDKVYVTQELEGNMCLGVCNECYGKFPDNILRMLTEEEERTLGIQDDIHATSDSDESDLYDSVEDVGIYKVPRSLPCLLDSDSDDHTYDVPPNAAELIGSVTDSEEPEGRYKKVPIRQKTFRVSRQRISSHLRSATPGRLLSSFADASSHDTGLDRLGIPRSTREDTRQSKTVTLHAALARAAAGVDERLSEDDTWGSDIPVPSYTMDVTSGLPDSTDESQDAMERGSESQSATSLQPSGGGYSASDSECYDDIVVKKRPRRPDMAKGHSSESEPAGDSPKTVAQEGSATLPEIDPVSDQNTDPVEDSRPQDTEEAAAQQTDHTVHLSPHREHTTEPHFEAEDTVERATSPEDTESVEKLAELKITTPEASPQHRIKRLLPAPPTIVAKPNAPAKPSPLVPERSPPSPLVAHETRSPPPLTEIPTTDTLPEKRGPPLPEKPQKAIPPPPPPLTEEGISPPEKKLLSVPTTISDGADRSTETPPTNSATDPPIPENRSPVPPKRKFPTPPVSPTQTKTNATPLTPEGSPIPARRTFKPRVAPVPKPRRQIPASADLDSSPPVSYLEKSAPAEGRAIPLRLPSIPRKPEPPPISPKPNRRKLTYNTEKKDE